MERELIATGIGGQGVQIAVTILAKAAAASGRKVMTFSMFGGAIRGGRSECTLVVSDDEIEAPPIVPETQFVLALHDRYLDGVISRLRNGGLAVVNADLVAGLASGVDVLALPLTRIAEENGSASLVSMCGLGAVVASTSIVTLDEAVAAMAEEIPAYRRERIPQNEAAIRAGAAAAAGVTA